MDESANRPPRESPATVAVESPFMSFISACLFLFIGFVLPWVRNPDRPIVDASILVMMWGARIVGIGLVVVTVLSFFGSALAYALDLAMGSLAGLGCLVVGAIWLAYGDYYKGGLLILFGLLNGSAARAAWLRWRAHRASRAVPGDP